MPPLITNILMIAISVVARFVAWLLDRRKRRRGHKKFDKDREAVKRFLHKIPASPEKARGNEEFSRHLGAFRVCVSQERWNFDALV